MISFKTLAAAVLLSATAATPAFAQHHPLYIKNIHDSGYNPKNDFNPNGTMRAAIQEPGLEPINVSENATMREPISRLG
jgi:hypothetical protein